MARPCSKTKDNTQKLSGQTSKVGWRMASKLKIPEKTRQPGFQSCSLLLLAGMVPCYPMAVDFNKGKPGTVAAGGTSSNTPSSYGRCVALLPISSELWSCSVEPRTSRSQNSSRKGQMNIQPHQKQSGERN